MRSVWKALFTFLFLSLFLISCDSPIAPTSIDSGSGGEANGSQGGLFSSLMNDVRAGPDDVSCGDPNDWDPDDSALQACLDKGGNIILSTVDPGYIVNRGVLLTREGTSIVSSNPLERAKIIAGRDLFGHILSTPPGISVNNFSIQYISFDGKVDDMVSDGPYRRLRDTCFDPGGNPGNLSLNGNGFQFNNNESTHAMCGSGLGVIGSNFSIQNNYIAYNGRDKFSSYSGVPWSDGITVISCNGGYIGHNNIVDNTDIDLVIGGGYGCVVELNTIAHFGKYAFAGLNIGNFNGSGDHIGSEFRGNVIHSGVRNRLSMGILAGSHPWTSKVDVKNAGKIVGNTSYGNVMNMVVDGVHGGEITGNNLYDPRGNQGLGVCGDSLNYTVYPPHVSGTILQPGWVSYQYDGDIACGFYDVANKFNLIR